MLDRYEKKKVLGEGNYGKCYLAVDRTTGERCVLKQVEILGMSEQEVAETVKEAQILEALNHPFIIKFESSFKAQDDKLFIVMHYADGGDLCSRIQQAKSKGKIISEQQILKWMTQLCLAIKHVHDRKIIHRDIKTQNVFLTKDGDVRLGDFGIARPLQLTMQKLKSVVGTPYYMSPQICENKEYSFQTDIWSLGVIILQLCLLRPPFQAGSLASLALKITSGAYLPIPSHYSQDLRQLVSKMVEIEAGNRPTINQILEHPLLKPRIEGQLSTPVRQNQFSHTVLHSVNIFDKPIKPCKELLLDFEEDSDSLSQLNMAVSPKSQSQNVQGISKHVEGRKVDPKRKKQLRKRQISEPNLTPKNYGINESKRVIKNPSAYNFDKKKSKDGMKKKSKITSQKQIEVRQGDRMVSQLLDITQLRDQIKSLHKKGIQSDIHSAPPPLSVPDLSKKAVSSSELSNNDRSSSPSCSDIEIPVQSNIVEPRGFRAKRGRDAWSNESVLQTLEGILRSRTHLDDLDELYGSCQKSDGICLSGPCAGLVTVAYALKNQQ